jgi:hypothetical protein
LMVKSKWIWFEVIRKFHWVEKRSNLVSFSVNPNVLTIKINWK